MIKAKKILAMILCVIICMSLCPTVFAAESDTPVIKISNVSAAAGDTVTINIDISNNPGIMGMMFRITYDSNSLQYSSYQKGYLSSYTVKDHSDKGYISFVNVESKDVSTDGTIISIIFKVTDNATAGKHIITLANSNDKYGTKLHNSFSNSKEKFIVPTVSAGSVTIAETCKNSGHKYGDWTVVRNAGCTATGLKQRTCTRCQNIEEDTIPITHDFEAEWTVDKAATPEEDGIMSRHCTKCDAVTDKITFSYEEIGGDDGDDTDGTSSDQVSGDTSNDNNSDTDTSQDNSSDSNTSNEDTSGSESSSDTSSTSSQTSSNQSTTTTSKKPVINNTEGAKVPLSEVEKLEDYIENIKPTLDDTSSEESSSENTSSEDVSSQTDTTSSELTPSTTTDSDSAVTQEEDPSFFKTPMGIIMAVLCGLISAGIIALGVVLIIRGKKNQ